MVRVVSPPPVKKCQCQNCKAGLEYEYSDVKSEWIRDYGGGLDEYHRITCPNCGMKVNVRKWSASAP